MKGLATACKDRWCVILPRYLPPRDGEPSGTVRVMLWMYRDAASVEPRTRVWLDGASAMRAGAQGGEALLVSAGEGMGGGTNARMGRVGQGVVWRCCW